MNNSLCWYAVTAFLTVTLLGCEVAPVRITDDKIAQAIPIDSYATPIEFRKIVTKIPLGEEIGQLQYGWGCFPGTKIGWRGGQLNITDEELTTTFREELERKNYPVVGDPYALFGDPSAGTAEILVAGWVEKVDLKVCFPLSGSPNVDIGNRSLLKGGTYMRVKWQLYSRSARKVVYETSTEGSYKTEETVSGGVPLFLKKSFAANVRNLLADSGFRSLVLKPSDPKLERTPALNSGSV